MASPVACWMLVTKQPCLREEIKRFALSWRKIYGNRWKRLAWGRAKMPAIQTDLHRDVYAQTEQDSRKIITASSSQGKALQLSKPASGRTKRASRTAVGILLIPPEQCLNIYSHPTKGRKDCYFSLQLHAPCHSPPEAVSHWNLLQRARDQLCDWLHFHVAQMPGAPKWNAAKKQLLQSSHEIHLSAS